MHVRIGNGTRALRRPGAATAAVPEDHIRVPEPVVPASAGISPSPARRALDVAVAIAILSLVWPLFLALVVATSLSTGGSAIYRQRRAGPGGWAVTIYTVCTLAA